jgi:hypothetical protein
MKNRGIVVDIGACYRLDDRGTGVRVPVESRILTSLGRPDRRTQLHKHWVPGNFFPGLEEVKRLGCEADHSAPTSVEVKKMWGFISNPTYFFMALCLIRLARLQF